MSRRDTIIIAVLVNAGLLMVLFATALRSDHKKEQIATLSVADTPSRGSAPSLIEPLAQLTPAALPELVAPAVCVPTLAPLATATIVEPIILPESAPVVVVEKPAPKPKPVAQDKPMSQNFVNVTVKKGDFLDKIAKAHQTTVAAIMKENQLTSTDLKIGQVLHIPSTQPATAQVAMVESPSATEYYVVKEGDNPWLIASKNRVKLEELLKINGLDEQSARRLRPGDRLKIR